MNRATRVVIDSLRGEALLGETVVAIANAGSRGEIQVGGVGGPILRPLTFGERTHAVSRAALSPRPRENVCAAILNMATVQPGAAGQTAQEILALILAGADQERAPSFAEAALLVARGTGWGPAQLADAPATDVDRLAIHLGGRRSEPSWNRLLLASSPADELTSIRADLADNLLRRTESAPQAAEARQLLLGGGAFEDAYPSGSVAADSPPGTGSASAATRQDWPVISGPTHSQTWDRVAPGAATPATSGPGPVPSGATPPSLHLDRLVDSGQKAASPEDERQRTPASRPAGTVPPGEGSHQVPRPGDDRSIRFRIRDTIDPRSVSEPATAKPADAHDEPVRLVRLDGTETPLPAPSNGASLPAAQTPYAHPNPTREASGTQGIEATTHPPATAGRDGQPGGDSPGRAESKPKSEQPVTTTSPSPIASGRDSPLWAENEPRGEQPATTTPLSPIASGGSMPVTIVGPGGRQDSAVTMATTTTSLPPAVQGQPEAMTMAPLILKNSVLHKVGSSLANEQPNPAAIRAAGLSSPHQVAEPLPGTGDSLSELADALATLLHDEADMRGIER